jgi:hypothetical protein
LFISCTNRLNFGKNENKRPLINFYFCSMPRTIPQDSGIG